MTRRSRRAAWRVAAAVLGVALAGSAVAEDPGAAAFLGEPVVLGAADGLDATSVVDVVQDRQGFLWFASLDAGLLRYDGYVFRSYTHDPADARSISSNEVRRLYFDRDGVLWVGTGDGLNRYEPRTDSFERVGAGDDGSGALASQGIANVLVDRSGTLWVGTEAGLDRLDRGAREFRHYDNEKVAAGGQLAPNFFWSAYEDPQGGLWFGTLGGGLLRYRAESDTFDQYVWNGEADDYSPASVRSIHMDREGKVWVACDEGLVRLDPSTGRFDVFATTSSQQHVAFGLPGNRHFFGVHEDRSGRLWVSSVSSGLARWEPDLQRFVAWPGRDRRPPDAPTSAWKVFEDATGTIWTIGGWMGRFLPAAEALEDLGQPPIPEGAPSVNAKLATTDQEGNLYVASGAGAHVLDAGTRTWRALPSASIDRPTEAQAIYVDPNGEVWVSSLYKGELLRMDRSGRVRRIYSLPGRAFGMLLDRAGRLWAAVPYVGVVRLDPATGVTETFSPDPVDPGSLSHVSPSRVHEDRAGRIWVATYDGLNRFLPESGKFRVYRHDASDPSSLGTSGVGAICEASNGDLWFATGAGLSRYLPETDNFERQLVSGDAAENRLGGGECTRDAQGQFWLSHGSGLVRFDPVSRQVASYAFADGVPKAWVTAAHGSDLYLMHEGKAFRFRPERMRGSRKPPPIAITGLHLKDQPVAPSPAEDAIIGQSIWTLPPVTLRHDQYPVTFEFAALDFADPTRSRYAYRMDGVDADWISSSPKIRQATYTTLSPGRYTFRVKAANKDGVWNDEGVALEVIVLPPWWQTWWAYAAYLLAGLLLLMLVVRWRTSLLRERAAQLELVVDARTRELVQQKQTIETQAQHLAELVDLKDRLMTRISHEFRTPLTVILGPLERVAAGVSDAPVRQYLDSTRRNASRLLRLVDQLLGLARLSAGRSEPTAPVALAPLVRQVVASFESLAGDRRLDLRLGTVEEVTALATSDAVEKVCVNLVSNALKFTPAGGSVTVELRSLDREACLSVIDTGVGIAADQQDRIFEPFERAHGEAERVPGSGLGLALVRELVTAQGGRADVDSTPGRGSTFRACWPLAEASGAGEGGGRPAGPSEEARVEVAALREAQPVVQGAVPESGPGREATVLLVEDNADMQRYLLQLLGDRYRCIVADDGDAGVRLATEEIPDLVVCDVLLPAKDGYDVCHELKSNERTSHVPVIMLTALESREHRLRGLLEKADDYLTKPFDEAELRQRIANLLEIRSLLRERYVRDIRFDESPPADLNARDRAFLERLARLVAKRHAEPDLDVAQLAGALAMSERQLQRKLKALVNLSPAEYLRAYRLQRALDRLRSGERVGDVAMAVGFSSQAYFSTCFRARFGYPPNEARTRAGS